MTKEQIEQAMKEYQKEIEFHGLEVGHWRDVPRPRRLFHYSAQPLSLPIQSREQNLVEEQFPHSKPKGFWLSVEGEDDWPHWCQGEEFKLEGLTHSHEVRLEPKARIITLRSPVDIDVFTARYGRVTPHTFLGTRAIQWSAVASDYQGIVIAPYVWSRRLHTDTTWYYGWDCASGCIWDASAVAEVAIPGLI